MKPVSIFLFVLLFSLNSALASASWFYTSSSNRKGQAMVIHGLNTKPSKMNSIVRELRTNGYDVLRVTLKGHSGPISEMQAANRAAWQGNITSAYGHLSRRYRRFGGDNLIVGYSLGGLVSVNYLLGKRRHIIDRLVLFAPALSVTVTSSLVRGSFFLDDNRIIPSMSPEAYKAQRGVSIRAYKSLFSLVDGLSGNRSWSRVNIPTQIFIHPSDELVSLSGLEDLVREKSLSRWDVTRLNISGRTASHSYKHLVIDPASVGSTEWRRKISPALR